VHTSEQQAIQPSNQAIMQASQPSIQQVKQAQPAEPAKSKSREQMCNK